MQVCTSLQTDNLPPNQQRQSTEGNAYGRTYNGDNICGRGGASHGGWNSGGHLWVGMERTSIRKGRQSVCNCQVTNML